MSSQLNQLNQLTQNTQTKKRDNSSLDDVFVELDFIKNQLSTLSQKISSIQNDQNVYPLNKKSKLSRGSKGSRNSFSNKDQFNSADERILQLLTVAILYSANQIGVSSTNEEQDLRHTLGVVIPRSCCINFLNINQHVAQPKEKVEIVVYLYDKDDKIELPVTPFVNNVRIIKIQSIVDQLFQTSPSTLKVLVLCSEIQEIHILTNVIKGNKNIIVISLFNEPKHFDGDQDKIVFFPQMLQSYQRLIRYVVYSINKNSQLPIHQITKDLKKVFSDIDTPQDFENGVISLYSPLFANVLSTFLEMKSEWKHLIPLVMNQSTGESFLNNQSPWSKVWKTKREFLSHLSLNEFLTCYDTQYQSGANERSKFSSPEIVNSLLCNHTEKHEAKNFIFVPMSTIHHLTQNRDFKKDLLSLLNQISPEIIQKAYTKFPFRKTFDFNRLKETIANCLLNQSSLPKLDSETSEITEATETTAETTETTEATDQESSKNEEFTDWEENDENEEECEDNDKETFEENCDESDVQPDD